MITNDKGIVELKDYVIREVCRLAWNGELTHDNLEHIVYSSAPGRNPSTDAVSIRRERSSGAVCALPRD